MFDSINKYPVARLPVTADRARSPAAGGADRVRPARAVRAAVAATLTQTTPILMAAIVVPLLAHCAQAATISIDASDDVTTVVLVEGIFEPDDAKNFRGITDHLTKATVGFFNADGGNLMEGIRIGEFIRQKGFSTVVLEGDRCVSACALAWLGGVERFMTVGSKIGFHAAYDASTGQQTGIGNALIGAYLNKLGLPYQAVAYMTKATPDSKMWLTSSDADKYQIKVTELSPLVSPSANVSPTAIRASPATRRPKLTRDEVGLLVNQAAAFISDSDLGTARLLLQRAAEVGDARAALTLGATYDPLALRALRAVGIAPNVTKAREWYQRAAEYGSVEASRRLGALGLTR